MPVGYNTDEYDEFCQKASSLQSELKEILQKMEELAITYGHSVHVDGPAYGMGGWFEPITTDPDDEDYWEPDYCEKREDGKGYWQASSTSC